MTTEKAQKINEYLSTNLQATVEEIAGANEMEEQEVIDTLNCFRIEDDGNITTVEYGQGGGWAPARAQEVAMRQEQVAFMDELIRERESILATIPDDDDKERQQVRESLQGQIDEIKSRRQEIDG